MAGETMLKSGAVTSEATSTEGYEGDLAALLHAHWERLFRFARRHVGGDKDAAEDVRQATAEALVMRWRTSSTHLAADYAVCLLYSIARNKAVDHFRRQQRERTHRNSDALAEFADRRADDQLVAVLTRFDLHASEKVLTPRQQQILELVYLDDLDQQTTAQILGITVSAVEKHLAAARKHLRHARLSLSTPGSAWSKEERR